MILSITKTTDFLSEFIINDESIMDPVQRSNCFNVYCSNIGHDLASNITLNDNFITFTAY